jgi:hypothetical protein
MKRKLKSKSNNSDIGYRLYADKAFMDFLRPMHEEKFTKMDAYCYLLDKAVANAQDCESSKPTGMQQAAEVPFVITITDLAERWHWHRATVRGFLNDLVSRGRMVKKAQPKSYLVTMKLSACNAGMGCPYALILDDTDEVASLSTKLSGQMTASSEDAASVQPVVGEATAEPQQNFSVEDMLDSFFTYMACNPHGYDVLAQQRPTNLLKSFNCRFSSDPDKHQAAVSILARSLKTATPPCQDEAVSVMSDAERDLLDRIYLRYICRRCATANYNN